MLTSPRMGGYRIDPIQTQRTFVVETTDDAITSPQRGSMTRPRARFPLLFSTAVLLAILLFTAARTVDVAAAKPPRPTPTPTSTGVNAQAVGTLDIGKRFCLPAQQIVGKSGGQVAGGGFTFDNFGGNPLAVPWTISSGPDPGNLSIIAQQTTSYFHEIFTLPIGSYFQTCIDNNTSVVISYQMQQSETALS
jgi:hypothetical protein